MSLREKSVAKGFSHSVKVPRLYKVASSILKRVVENGESLKQLIYNTRHKNVKGIYALVVETIKNSKVLEKLIKKSKLFQKETRLEPWLGRILIMEMVFRKKELKGNSKPIQTILSYKQTFFKLIGNNENVKVMQVKKPRYVRINTLLCTIDEVVKLFRNDGWILLPKSADYSSFLLTISHLKPNEFIKDFHITELLVFPFGTQFYDNELYINGTILLQDKASCLPVYLLRPPSHSTVLDMCAAPGMKTSHLSAKMKNKGTLYAMEKDESRYNTMCKFLEKIGCTNVKPINQDALLIGRDAHSNIDASWYKDVEYILVDPSCSGTGIVERKHIFVDDKVDAKRLRKLCGFQFKLLLHALTKFPKVKRVVYSTCSVQAIENEKVVEDVLRKLYSGEGVKHDEKNINISKFKLTEASSQFWHRRGSDAFSHGQYCFYADPDKDLTNGFFIAVFERTHEYDFDEMTEENSLNDAHYERKKMKK